MKKNQLYALTLLFAIIALGFSSCSKEKSFTNGGSGGTGGTGGTGGSGGGNSTYFVKFKIDGVQKQYSSNMFALFNSIDIVGTMMYTASFQGSLGSDVTKNLLGISITDTAPIVINKDYTDAIAGQTIQGVLLYFDATGEQYSSIAVTTDVNLKIRLTELTNSVAAGTFSGKVQSLTGGAPLVITEGSFKIKR